MCIAGSMLRALPILLCGDQLRLSGAHDPLNRPVHEDMVHVCISITSSQRRLDRGYGTNAIRTNPRPPISSKSPNNIWTRPWSTAPQPRFSCLYPSSSSTMACLVEMALNPPSKRKNPNRATNSPPPASFHQFWSEASTPLTAKALTIMNTNSLDRHPLP